MLFIREVIRLAQLSDMLVFLRKRKGLSQQGLADALKLSRSAIGMYETGKREPDLETLELFADFYNVDMKTLTGRNPLADAHTQKIKSLHKFKRNSDYSASLDGISIDSWTYGALAFLAKKNRRSLQDEIDDRLFWSVDNELDE